MTGLAPAGPGRTREQGSVQIVRPQRRKQARRIAMLCIALLAMGLMLDAQERVRGAVVNRDGVPQRGCRVEFFWNQQDRAPASEANTDDYGNFYLHNPPRGSFDVRVTLGSQPRWIRASIDANGIQPTPLVVNW